METKTKTKKLKAISSEISAFACFKEGKKFHVAGAAAVYQYKDDGFVWRVDKQIAAECFVTNISFMAFSWYGVIMSVKFDGVTKFNQLIFVP